MPEKCHQTDKDRICHRLTTFAQGIYFPDQEDDLITMSVRQLKNILYNMYLETNRQLTCDMIQGLEKRDLVNMILIEIVNPRWLLTQLPYYNLRCPSLRNIYNQYSPFQMKELCTLVNNTMKNRMGCQCCICLEDYTAFANLTFLPCGHCFHTECTKTWMVQQLDVCAQDGEYPSCPTCRTTINKQIDCREIVYRNSNVDTETVSVSGGKRKRWHIINSWRRWVL